MQMAAGRGTADVAEALCAGIVPVDAGTAVLGVRRWHYGWIPKRHRQQTLPLRRDARCVLRLRVGQRRARRVSAVQKRSGSAAVWRAQQQTPTPIWTSN